MSAAENHGLTSEGRPRCSGEFTTTDWSVVRAAGQADSPQAAAALEKLCRSYWYPLFAFVRRWGHGTHDAEDLTQEFLAGLLESSTLSKVDPNKGRFRTYLLACLRKFLSNAYDKSQALKRGGGRLIVSLDIEAGERMYAAEATDTTSPDRLFDQNWAVTTLDKAYNALVRDYQSAGKGPLLEALAPYLEGDRGQKPYRELATEWGLSESGAKMAVLRVRRRFGELLRQEIAHTVSSPEEIDEEIHHLFAVLAR